MPFSSNRFNRIVDLKGIKQLDLGKKAGIAQSQVSECKAGICRTNETTEKLARALDCTPDFLLGWSFPGCEDDDEKFRAAVSHMAYDAFATRDFPDDQKERCRKVLNHRAAPITADGWQILS